MAYDSMHEYYREQAVLPTYGRFRSQADLEAHERQRRHLFTELLYLPPRLFDNARLIEFGPDAGENSLVFAQWGANCTLVEPNPKAHQVLTDYFRQFGLSHRLRELQASDIKTYAEQPLPSEKFDLIDAEGFIYTVKPESLWIDLFSRLLKDDGFVVITYLDPFGNFVELFTKAIHAHVRRLTGWGAVETAQKLFLTKWNTIPHKRTLESWVMDVMENPFVRMRFFIEPEILCEKMQAAGLSLYASWPPCKDGLDVRWFKRALTPNERLTAQTAFIGRSRLSHVFGRTHFLRHPDPELERRLKDLVMLTDGLIDEFNSHSAAQCAEHLALIEQVIGSNAVVTTERDAIETQRAIQGLMRILRTLMSDNVNEVVTCCNTDPGFLGTWGGVTHFAVFRKDLV